MSRTELFLIEKCSYFSVKLIKGHIFRSKCGIFGIRGEIQPLSETGTCLRACLVRGRVLKSQSEPLYKF